MTKPQIIKKTREWQSRLGLENWDILITFKKIKREVNDIASCDADTQYVRATINYQPHRIGEVDDNTIIHELCHCLTAETKGYVEANGLYDKWYTFFDERQVSKFAAIICRLTK